MQDRPAPAALLSMIAALLREELVPALQGAAAYKARIAANLADIAARQIAGDLEPAAAETARLQRLLEATQTDLRALNTDLAERLSRRELDWDSPGVADHLWATTLAKLAVDQPSYPRYRQLTDLASNLGEADAVV